MSHDHAAPAGRARLAVAFGITAAVLVAEVIGSIVTGSLALLVDAAHMLTDIAALAIALTAISVARRPPDRRACS